MLRCETRCFTAGTILADSKKKADALMVITSGKVILSTTINALLCQLGLKKTQKNLIKILSVSETAALQVSVELPMDSKDASEEKISGGSNLLHVFTRGSSFFN